ncbi:metal ABC transporter substrate-binding protein [Patescibacteria group bacterium]|nr:metal ABC transporter substrate-binding protein [Patescibacteria group bacterium]MBU2613611.1 metal ABC transporter substrate-binding protein [Patescibacteria group bacterium]
MSEPQGISRGVYVTYAVFGVLAFALVFFLLRSAGFWSPLSDAGRGAEDAGRIPVVATIYPWGYLAERVGGDLVEVTIVTPPGAEPHDYEPTPRDIVGAHGARLFLLNGNGIDVWAERIEPEIARAGAETITFAARAPRIDAGDDPHVWLDLVFMQDATALVRDALVRIDPDHTATYRTNADATMSDLQDLDATYRDGLATCDLHEIVVSHDAFRYLDARYGLTSLAVRGISPVEEPSAKTLAELADVIRTKGLDVVFTETFVSPKLSETLAAETGARTLVLNPIGGLTADELATGETYLTVMRANLSNLTDALRCR